MLTCLIVNYVVGDNANEHQLPYYNELPSSPSVEDAKRLIVDEKKRPAVSEWPDNNKVWLSL